MVPAQAAAILVVPSLVTNIWQAVVGGGLIALARRLWPMLVGICLGTFVGAVLLPHDDTGQATIWLGVALALYAALGLLNVHFKVPQRAETWLGLVMGAATGAITVATGIFVMPRQMPRGCVDTTGTLILPLVVVSCRDLCASLGLKTRATLLRFHLCANNCSE